MQDIVRDKLTELVGRFGLDLCNDARRCEALLCDVCGDHKRQIVALVVAARDGVGSELRQSSAGVPKELIVARLTKRLHENVGLAENLARWAVESWAVALGIATAKEFRFPFKCPKCGAQGSMPTGMAGKKTTCPKCSANLFIADNGREVFLAPGAQSPSKTAETPSPLPAIAAKGLICEPLDVSETLPRMDTRFVQSTAPSPAAMADATYQKIQLVGTSTKSLSDAISVAVAKAAEIVKVPSWFEVIDQRGAISNGKVQQFLVTISIGGRME